MEHVRNSGLRVDLSRGTSGCYLLLLRGEVVYVGQSENVFQRINVHYRAVMRRNTLKPMDHTVIAQRKQVEFDAVELIMMPLHMLNHEENRLIRHYRPKYNSLLNRVEIIPGMENHPAFRDLLAKSQEPKFRKVPR